MKTQNAAFILEKAKTGNSPRTLLVFHFYGGDVLVSDGPWTFSGLASPFRALVLNWGSIYSQTNPNPMTLDVADCKLTLSNTEATPFSNYFLAQSSLSVQVDVYHAFAGLLYSQKEAIGTFVISDVPTWDSEKIEIDLVAEIEKRDKLVGTLINTSNWPYADPDAVNRLEDIVYGSVKNKSCACVRAGGYATLAEALNATDVTSTVKLSLLPGYAAFSAVPFVMTIEKEDLNVTVIDLINQTATATRGYNSTPKDTHAVGCSVWEKRTDYTFLVAGHPVKAIGNVFVDGVRVLTGITKNVSTSGKATVVFSSKFTLEKSVDLGVNTGSHSHDNSSWSGAGTRTTTTRWTASVSPGWTTNFHVGSAFKDSAGYYFMITANGANYIDVFSIEGRAMVAGTYTGAIIPTQIESLFQDGVSATFNAPVSGVATALCDKALDNFANIIVSTGYMDTLRSFAVSNKGSIIGAKFCAAIGNGTYNGIGRSAIQGGLFNGQYVQGGTATLVTYRTNLARTVTGPVAWSDFAATSMRATFVSGTAAASFSENWIEVYYIPSTGGSSPATGVALTGNSAADIVVGGHVTCDVDGYADDVYGTYTSTPSSLIQNPSDIQKHLLTVYAGVPLATIDGSFSTSRTSLAAIAGGYKFAVVISKQEKVKVLIGRVAFQARSRVLWNGWVWRFIFIPSAPGASQKSITTSMMLFKSFKSNWTSKDEIVNDMNIHYNPDWSKDVSPESCFGGCDRSATYPAGGDAASVTANGIKEKPEWCMMEFVPTAAMASDLRDFYIGRYKDRARRVSFAGFSDCVDIEQGDTLDVTHPAPAFNLSALIVEVENTKYVPGSGKSKRGHHFEVVAREL